MDVELRTPRLLLRRPRHADSTQIARFLNNFRVAGNLSRVPYPYGEADALAWLGQQQNDLPPGHTSFAIDLPGEGIIGICGFHDDIQGIVIGYWLGEPFWTRGFMTEAAAALVDWYFEVTEAAALGSGAFHFNRASLAVQRKLGFAETGTSVRHCLARKQEVRHIDTELTRAHWAETSGRAPEASRSVA